jgi:hypothetical protein
MPGEITDPSRAPRQLGKTRSLRRMILAAALLTVLQTAVGMVVNLYVTVPAHHPGSQPADYLTGSYHSVGWAIIHGPVALAVDASLGLAFIIAATGVAVSAARLRITRVTLMALLAALLAVGAGFNGASFLDFHGQNISSLLMAFLGLSALSCYLLGMYQLDTR